MTKKVGIITRPKDDKLTIKKEITDILIKKGVIPIGIIPITISLDINESDLKKTCEGIDLCDGVILQGGEDFYEYDFKFVKYLYEKDIPTLGICLGMQTIACYFGGKLKKVDKNNHLSTRKYVHEINISSNSKLYEIIKRDKIMVNSRHSDYVFITKMDIVAYSSDGIIEAIEDRNKRFFIGVQWHPESTYYIDCYSKKLIDRFIDSL